MGGQQRQIRSSKISSGPGSKLEKQRLLITHRLGLVGPQLASVIGGFPAATQVQSTPPPSATQQLLGLGIGGRWISRSIRVFWIIMSRILRRPMFRGGQVSSYGTGIASGLEHIVRAGMN